MNTPPAVSAALSKSNPVTSGPSSGNLVASAQETENPVKHVETPTKALEDFNSDIARRASFKRILDEIDPMLSKTAQGSTASRSQATAPAAGGGQSGVDVTQLQNLLATLQNSQSSQLQQAILSSLTGNSLHANLSQIAAQHQLQQLQQHLLLNLAGSGSNLSNNFLSAALLGSATPTTTVASSSTNTLNSSALVSSPGSSLGSPAHTTPRSSNITPEQFQEETQRKRDVRLKKNREAARECRRKKKEYVRCLENRVAVLESQNQALIGELRALKELYLPKSDS